MLADTERLKELRALAAHLGIVINDFELFDRALTHASIASESRGSGYDYEALEFLGDAALGLAAAHHLFRECPDRTPGEYSRMRAGVVNRRCLSRVARRLGIVASIRLGKGEELAGGRSRMALLADCLEALMGALYIDQGWSAVSDFVARVFRDEFERERSSERVWDFKSRLQHYCQARRFPLPEFVVVRSEGPDHRKAFVVEVIVRGRAMGRGTGFSKKEAEQHAARAALEDAGQHFE